MLFSNFPKIRYDIAKTGIETPVVDIVKRFSPLQKVIDRVGIYFDYFIKEKERPETVAHKIYNNADYHWIVLAFNQYYDPYYSWPLDSEEFQLYLEDKYGSYETSTQIVQRYELILQEKETNYDGTFTEERVLEIDQNTYLNTEVAQRRIIYAYDHEFELNEAKRRIKLIDSKYINQILTEKENIFG